MSTFKRFNSSNQFNHYDSALEPGTLSWDENNGLRLHDGTTVGGNEISGVTGVPQNLQTGTTYTLTLDDIGKHVYMSAENNGSNVLIIPTEAELTFPIGTAVTVVTGVAATYITANILVPDTNGVKIIAVGGNNSGTNPLEAASVPAYSIATMLKVADSLWYVTGAGLQENWC